MGLHDTPINDFHVASLETGARQDEPGVALAEAGDAVGQGQRADLGEDEAVVVGHEQVERARSAGDGDRSLKDAQSSQQIGDGDALGVPEGGQRIGRVGCQVGDGSGENQPTAAGVGVARMAEAAQHHDSGAIQRCLE